MIEINLNYGKNGFPLKVDKDWDITVIEKAEMPVLSDPSEAIANALAVGVNADALLREAKAAKSACILICDITRPVPNSIILPPILNCLIKAGLGMDAIRVLVATGLHRPNEGRELEELVGDRWVLENFVIENHFAEDDNSHVSLGHTSKGTPVKLDRRFVESDLRIVTGLVEPHFMAGFSGGRKVVSPGVAHQDTIKTFHNFRFMSDEKTENCVLNDNPLHLEQLEIVKKVGRVLAVNTVLDDDRRLSFVNYGEVVESHLAAVNHVKKYMIRNMPRRYSTVLTSAAGYPLDQTYYQTVKGMISPLDIVSDDGDLIIVSACEEGLGSKYYEFAQKRLVEVGTDQFLSEIRAKSLADTDEWQTQMQIKAMSVVKVHLFTEGLTESQKRLTGVNVIDSVEDTIRNLVLCKPDKSIAVIPEGPYVVPKFHPNC